jgi:hypothetical protein
MTSVCHCWFGAVGRKLYSPSELTERFQRDSRSAPLNTRYTVLSPTQATASSTIIQVNFR